MYSASITSLVSCSLSSQSTQSTQSTLVHQSVNHLYTVPKCPTSSWLHSAHWWIFSRILSDRWSLRAWSPLSATSCRRTCSIRIWLIRRQNSASRSRRRLPKRCSTVLRFQPWCRSLTFVTYMPKRKSLTSVWMWLDTQAPRRNTMKKYYQSK